MGPVASCSLFFDVQVLTFLSEKYSLFAHANLCHLTTRLRSYFLTIFAAHLCVFTRMMGCKASLASHRTCTYVLVTEKNRLACKGPSRHTCDFRTKCQGRTGPAMKISMQIFPACMQDVYKRIHASRVTYERLVHVHSPYVHIFQQYLQHTYVSIHVRRDVREA